MCDWPDPVVVAFWASHRQCDQWNVTIPAPARLVKEKATDAPQVIASALPPPARSYIELDPFKKQPYVDERFASGADENQYP